MATVGSIAIGVSANTAALSKDLNKGAGLVQGFTAKVQGIGSGLGSVFGAIGGGIAAIGIGAGLKHSITAASDLAESIGKTEIVLGPASDAVKAYADDAAARFGLVKRETLDAASAFGGLGKGLAGLQGKELSDFSVQFTKLSADLSSFANVSFEEAKTALQAGLIGNESDTLKGLGVILTADQVAAHAFASGIAVAGTELTEAQKVASRAQLIMSGLADAQGNLELTADGVANSTKEFQGRLENLSASGGQALEPITSGFLQLGNTLLTNVAGAFETNKGLIDNIGFALRNAQDIATVAVLKIQEGFLNVGETIAVIPQNLGIIANYIATNWYQLIRDGVVATLTVFDNLGQNIANLGASVVAFLQDPTKGFQFNFTPLLDGFKATAAELPTLIRPELTSLQGEIDSVLAGIGEKEIKRAANLAAAVAKTAIKTPEIATPAAAAKAIEKDAAKAGPEKLNAGALELGSAEARSAVLANRTGGAGDPLKSIDKSGKDTLMVQRQTLNELRKLNKDNTQNKVLTLAF